MRYESTRGAAPVLGFADALLAGLAADGGLYHASRITTAKVRQPKTLIGSTLRCCAACPKINPARSQEVAS